MRLVGGDARGVSLSELMDSPHVVAADVTQAGWEDLTAMLIRERDEARAVARRLMEAVDYRDYEREHGELPGVLYERYSWLKQST